MTRMGPAVALLGLFALAGCNLTPKYSGDAGLDDAGRSCIWGGFSFEERAPSKSVRFAKCLRVIVGVNGNTVSGLAIQRMLAEGFDCKGTDSGTFECSLTASVQTGPFLPARGFTVLQRTVLLKSVRGDLQFLGLSEQLDKNQSGTDGGYQLDYQMNTSNLRD